MTQPISQLILRKNKYIDGDVLLDLRGTKAIKLEYTLQTDKKFAESMVAPESLLSIDVTTWSSLVRNAIDILKPQIDYLLHNVGSQVFRTTFESCLSDVLEKGSFKPNTNYVKRLFREAEIDDLIHSTVYLNNKNHKIKIITDEAGIDYYICAVYTGEIIWTLEALLNTLDELFKFNSWDVNTTKQHTLVISYIDRDNVNDNSVDIDEAHENVNIKEFERDVISMSLQLKETVFGLFSMAKKYNLPKAEDIISGIFAEDLPSEINESRAK